MRDGRCRLVYRDLDGCRWGWKILSHVHNDHALLIGTLRTRPLKAALHAWLMRVIILVKVFCPHTIQKNTHKP